MLTINAATHADVQQLNDLLSLLFTQEADFKPDAEKQQRGLRLILDSPQAGIIFAAREGGAVIGMVSLLFTISTAEGGPACWLEDMVVGPEHRGSGLGSRLLEHAVAHARANGFSRITLLTDKMNAGAIRFYQRQGFTPSAMTALRLKLT